MSKTMYTSMQVSKESIREWKTLLKTGESLEAMINRVIGENKLLKRICELEDKHQNNDIK